VYADSTTGVYARSNARVGGGGQGSVRARKQARALSGDGTRESTGI